MAGAMLAAASHRVPIIVDGFIANVSALIADMIAEGASTYMFVGHQSVEPGHIIAAELLGKKPLVDLGMRIGEGTGAAVAFPIYEQQHLHSKKWQLLKVQECLRNNYKMKLI